MHELENLYNQDFDARRRDVLKGLRDAMLEAAIECAEHGAAIVLLHPKDKSPIAKGWTKAPRMPPGEVEKAIVKARVTHGDVNIGVRLGEPSRLRDGNYLHVVDVDIRNARESKRCLEEALAAVYAVAPELENAPRVLSGSGSGSCHIYFVTDKPLAKKNIARSKRMCGDRPEWEADLFGTGAQVVLPPSVHPSGNRYQWDERRRPFFDDERQRGRRILVSAESLAPLYERRRERSARDAIAVKIFGGRIDVARSALDAIGNDDLDYDEWFRRLCALHFEGDDSDEWRALAHEFSRKSGKYDADTTDRKWDSIKNKHADLVTGATIRQLARKAGWTPESAGFPGFEWADGWTEAGSQIVFEDEREIGDIIESMNAEFAVVKNKGSVRILHQCVDEDGVDSFDLMKQEDFRLLTRARGVVKAVSANGKTTKSIPIADYWLNSPQRREYAGLVFRPGEEPHQGDGSDKSKFLNLWTRWGVEPSKRGSWERLKKHLLENVCNGDKGLLDYLLDWCAHLVQRPREKPGVALVFRGVKGAGKSILGETLGKLVGKAHYFVASQPEQILGKHNAQLARAHLIQAEEAFFVHDPKTHGPLKDLITRTTRTIEPKFVDAFIVEACDRLIMTSNKDAVVPADRGERRYTVFDVADTHARDTAYFGALVEELENGGYERFLYDLLNRDLRGFDCRTAFETEALAKQKLHALDTTAQWAFDELTSGELWEGNSRGEPCFIVDKRHVRKSYLEFVRDMKVGHPLADSRLGEWLIGNLGFKASRQRIEGKREPCYVLPALWVARERFIAQFELPTTIFDGADGKGPQKRRDVL